MPQPAAAPSPIDETSFLLEQWSRQARMNTGRSRLMFPIMTPCKRLLGGGALPGPLLSDAVALEVGYPVSRLVDLDPER